MRMVYKLYNFSSTPMRGFIANYSTDHVLRFQNMTLLNENCLQISDDHAINAPILNLA